MYGKTYAIMRTHREPIRRQHSSITILLSILTLLISHCGPPRSNAGNTIHLQSDLYFDKVYGAWQATMFANHIGLAHQGIYLDAPSPADSISLIPPAEWSTDDDTAVEWVDLHIMENYGLDPSYAEIRDEWVDHLNHDIWVSTRRARDLMDEGVLPPETGSAALNPDGVWSIDAQLQTELFGLIAPAMPQEAKHRAEYFARITNSGFAVDASQFYAVLYALAFIENDVETLLEETATHFDGKNPVIQVYNQVVEWHTQHPDDWRTVRRLIRDEYDTDPEWWAAKVNFAATIMARHGVAIDDVNELISSGKVARTSPDNVHFTQEGSTVLARHIADTIRRALSKE